MSSVQLINSIVEWERRMDFEDDRRKYHQGESYVNYLAAPQPTRKERKSIFAQIFGRNTNRQPVQTSRKEEPCKEAQPC